MAEDVAEGAKDLPYLLSNGTAQAFLRKLIKELRVMSKSEILPTYKIPALVRAPSGQVEVGGHYQNQFPVLNELLDRIAA